MKGLPIAAIARGHNCEVWFSSPTGDSSDSFTYDLMCTNQKQAIDLAEAYNQFVRMWESNVDNINYEAEQLKLEVEQLRRSLRNADSKIAALTTTLITHYDKSWFDQTVSF